MMYRENLNTIPEPEEDQIKSTAVTITPFIFSTPKDDNMESLTGAVTIPSIPILFNSCPVAILNKNETI